LFKSDEIPKRPKNKKVIKQIEATFGKKFNYKVDELKDLDNKEKNF
jgi:hypothetical protein